MGTREQDHGQGHNNARAGSMAPGNSQARIHAGVAGCNRLRRHRSVQRSKDSLLHSPTLQHNTACAQDRWGSEEFDLHHTGHFNPRPHVRSQASRCQHAVEGAQTSEWRTKPTHHQLAQPEGVEWARIRHAAARQHAFLVEAQGAAIPRHADVAPRVGGDGGTDAEVVIFPHAAKY